MLSFEKSQLLDACIYRDHLRKNESKEICLKNSDDFCWPSQKVQL